MDSVNYQLLKGSMAMVDLLGVKYLTEKEAAARYGYSVFWFQKARHAEIGPPYMKILGKGRVLYPVIETDEWFKKNMVKY